MQKHYILKHKFDGKTLLISNKTDKNELLRDELEITDKGSCVRVDKATKTFKKIDLKNKKLSFTYITLILHIIFAYKFNSTNNKQI